MLQVKGECCNIHSIFDALPWMFRQPPTPRGAKEPVVVSLLKMLCEVEGLPPWYVTAKCTVVTLDKAQSNKHQGQFVICSY